MAAKLPPVVTIVDGKWDFGLDQVDNSLDLLDPDINVFGYETELFLGMDDITWSLTTLDNAISYDNPDEEDDIIFEPALVRGVGTGMFIGMSVKGFMAMHADDTQGGITNFIY